MQKNVNVEKVKKYIYKKNSKIRKYEKKNKK